MSIFVLKHEWKSAVQATFILVGAELTRVPPTVTTSILTVQVVVSVRQHCNYFVPSDFSLFRGFFGIILC